MKKLRGGVVLLILIYIMVFTGEGKQREPAYNPYNLVRFHVIANSDLPEDQAIKEEVRDLLLAEINTDLAQVTEKAELQKIINRDLIKIKGLAENYLNSKGYNEEVRVEYGEFPFPIKAYGPLVLPAGNYKALKVTIGQGQGSNWWCVLFPPLCFVNITEGTPDKDSVEKLLQKIEDKDQKSQAKPIKFKFKILEIFQKKRSA